MITPLSTFGHKTNSVTKVKGPKNKKKIRSKERTFKFPEDYVDFSGILNVYKDDDALLLFLTQQLSYTKVGREFEPYINVLKMRGGIEFILEDKATDYNGTFTSCLSRPHDVKIHVCKRVDDTISTASTLLHEISHFRDYQMAIVSEVTQCSNFQTEVNAFANMYRFFIEGRHIHSGSYARLSDERRNLLGTAYLYVYENHKELREILYEQLTTIGYEKLDDIQW